MAEIHVTDATFEQEVMKSDLPVLVDFWAEWCGPCKMVGPIINELAKQYEGKFKVCKVNVDENNATAQQFGIMSIPTMLIFFAGKAVEQFVGMRPKEDIEGRMKKYID